MRGESFVAAAYDGMKQGLKKVSSVLNPYNYFQTKAQTEAAFADFMQKQNSINTADRSLYPFTERNPFSSRYEQGASRKLLYLEKLQKR